MGMFDNIVCEYPIDIPIKNHPEWQTKDTPAQFLDTYKIDADGQLWHETYDIEARSDPDATGIERLFGIATRVNPRWEKVTDFRGSIRFYGGDLEYVWEYDALFDGGKLLNIKRISPETINGGDGNGKA